MTSEAQQIPASNPASEGVDPSPPKSGRYPKWIVQLFFLLIALAARFLIWLACRLSHEGAVKLAMWFTWRFEPLTRERRQSNLRLFYADAGWNEGQLAALDTKHLCYLARLRAELACMFEGTPDELKAIVQVEGFEHLHTALARKRGVMVVSGHTATYWFLPAILAAYGHPVTAFFTPIKYRQIEKLLLRFAAQFNLRIAFVGKDASLAIRNAIRRNEVVYLSFDVSMQLRRKEIIPFGGAFLEIDPGPALLAVRSDMPVLQAACLQTEMRKSRITFYAPEEQELCPQTSDGAEICRRWTQRLEQEVKQNPAQWWPWGYMPLRPPGAKISKPE